jgi:energy-coupling factor transporter ATP-binding protein EcfA2
MPRKKESEDIDLKPYDYRRLNPVKDGFRVLIVGKTGSGKGRIIEHLIYALKDIPRWVCYCPTSASTNQYESMIHPLMVHDKPSRANLECMIAHQKYIINKYCTGGKGPFRTYRKDVRRAVIFDDCAFSRADLETPEMIYLAKNSRNEHMLVVTVVQKWNDAPPSIRSQASHVILLNVEGKAETDQIYKDSGGSLSLKKFTAIFNAATSGSKEEGNKLAFVIDKTSLSNNPADRFFYVPVHYDRPPNPEDLDWMAGDKAINDYLNKKLSTTWKDQDGDNYDERIRFITPDEEAEGTVEEQKKKAKKAAAKKGGGVGSITIKDDIDLDVLEDLVKEKNRKIAYETDGLKVFIQQ